LKSGDIVNTINDIPILSASAAPAAYSAVKDTRVASVSITRRNQREAWTVRLVD